MVESTSSRSGQTGQASCIWVEGIWTVGGRQQHIGSNMAKTCDVQMSSKQITWHITQVMRSETCGLKPLLSHRGPAKWIPLRYL